ncbi:MAG: LLM class flavin-dependent oxidoreductase [Dehalococcoidia bacterium]|nr:LLM class flavin-dependent oxidoreductase [Dehalococcoidia bacterium]
MNLGIGLANILPVRDLVALSQHAERRGWHSVWITEGTGAKDVITQMSAVALATSRIRVASGIIPIWTRTPVMLGASFLGLDELSDGRAIMGLGAGHSWAIRDYHGIEPSRAVARMRDTVAIAKLLFRQPHFSYQGATARVINYRRTVTPARDDIPVYIAALGPQMLRLAGQCADGVIMNAMTPAHISRAAAIVRAAALAAGRDPSRIVIGAYLLTCVHHDPAVALRVCRRMIANYARDPYYAAMLRDSGFGATLDAMAPAFAAGDLSAAASLVPQHVVDALALYGPAESCRRRLQTFLDAGLDLPVIHAFHPRAPDPAAALRATIDALAPG